MTTHLSSQKHLFNKCNKHTRTYQTDESRNISSTV